MAGETFKQEREGLKQVEDLTVRIKGDFPTGSGGAGSVVLEEANTWYPVPSAAPDKDYTLVLTKENVSGTVRWSFSNEGVPSANNGNRLPDNLALDLGAGRQIYIGSTSAGDKINYTLIEK